MISWQTRRQALYFGTFFIFLVLVIGIPIFISVYRAPTCFDNKKNQGEEGIDCNGVCQRLCAEKLMLPTVKWVRPFHVSGDVYSVAALVENFNPDAGTFKLSYTFELYDKSNQLITEVRGRTFVLPKQTFLVFEGGINIKIPPVKAFLKFDSNAEWQRANLQARTLTISDKILRNVDTLPKLSAIVENSAISTARDVEVVAVISDTKNNAIAASRTIVNELAPNEKKNIVFTWPMPFAKQLEACVIPVDVVLVLDMSGSMNDDGGEPPQPITDTKTAAAAFVERLAEDDRVGVVTFADVGRIDRALGSRHEEAFSTINALTIESEVGGTNLGEGILLATEELNSNRHQNEAKKILVALSDGIANLPQEPGGEAFASRQAVAAKATGIGIYTIGLGNSVNRAFLESIATDRDHYFAALRRSDLEGIYKEISAAICEHGPAVIDIIPRSAGDLFN